MNSTILLVNPPFKHLKQSQTLPLGLMNIGTILKNKGYNIKIIDVNAEKRFTHDFLPDPLTQREFLREFRKIDPDIIGITSCTENYPIAMNLAQMCKDANENVKMLFGGVHATFQAIECLNHNPFIDLVVTGEAEHVIIDVIKALSGQQEMGLINNVIFRENGIIKYNQLNTLPNLSEIPPPDLELIKGKHYPSFILLLEFSRGCPFRCAFCCLSPFSERKVRYFPVKRIIDTLKAYQERFKNFSFHISDPTFLINQKRIREFLIETKNQGIELKDWAFETRIDTIDRALLKDLKKYRAYMVTLGIEDIHDSVLQAVGKQQTFTQIESAIKKLREFDFCVESNFIIGLPSQTREHMLENIAYSDKLDICGTPCLTPFPGSQIFSTPEQFGLKILSKNWELYTSKEILTNSVVFPAKEQKKVRELAWQHNAQIHLNNDSTFYFERKFYEKILEIGFDSWYEEWKKTTKTGWS